MRTTPLLILGLFFSLLGAMCKAQLYKVGLDEKVQRASLIIEAKVTDKKSFWNTAHTMIYTANTIKISKVFKGDTNASSIELLTVGGSVENYCVEASDLLKLEKGYTGIFFCYTGKVQSPFSKNILYNVYASDQGFLHYDLQNNIAFAPFVQYNNIEANLYPLLETKTGQIMTVIDNLFSVKKETQKGQGPTGVQTIISSFSPVSVIGGAINNPSKNVLTINGSGFGTIPSGQCAVKFKDGNDLNLNPTYEVPYNSQYIISWADNKIVLRVPARAASGRFGVMISNGNFTKADNDLDVFYAVLNAEFLLGADTVLKEPRLMNTNGSGGYSIIYSSSTNGNGLDFSSSGVRPTFERALSTWTETTGANLILNGTTTTQKVDAYDNKNIVMFDNANTTIEPLSAGVLATTYSGFSMCNDKTYDAQKPGFDIVVRHDGVSSGSVAFTNGPCFPTEDEVDMEMVLLHELGHALNLAHINDDYENTGTSFGTLNPGKVMHYSLLQYANRRSLDAAAYQGALYTIKPQGNTYGSCGLAPSEMIPGSYTFVSNDECPANFPATAITDGTTAFFDLAHTTSNKNADPAYTQVNCMNTGTYVTNNAYYAFLTDTAVNQSIALTISNYTTSPLNLASVCGAQGVRLALYDVSVCPGGQDFPAPVQCNVFGADGTLLPFSGLQPNHKYLLYFDGLRNTKAFFNVTFNGTASSGGDDHILPVIYPNPVRNTMYIRFTETSTTQYQYTLYDARGRFIMGETIAVSQANQVVSIPVGRIAPGVYFLRMADSKGNVVIKQKIIKQ